LFVLCPFTCSHCVVWPFSIYGFSLPLLYLQTLLILIQPSNNEKLQSRKASFTCLLNKYGIVDEDANSMQGITRATHVTIEQLKISNFASCYIVLVNFLTIVMLWSYIALCMIFFMIISLLELYSLDRVMYFCVRCLSNVFSTNKSDRHDIAEIPLRVA